MADDAHSILSGFIETAPDAMVLVRADGTIVEANRRADALFGHRDGIVGHAVEDLLPEAVGARHRGHRERYMADPSLRPMGTGLELRARRADGTEFDVDVSLGLLEIEGEQLVSAALRDITEEISTQQTLAEVHGRLTETQRLARIGLWLYDLASGEVQWSDVLYDITGVSPLDFGGDLDSFLGVVAAEERERVRKEIDDAIETGAAIHAEFPVVDADGVRRWFMCRGVAVVDGGRVVALQGICQDLTQRQRLLEALQQADRLKDEFLATVSHELRTPLTSIVGFSQMLRGELDGEHARWLDVVIRNGEEMNSMVERILDFSRLQSGRLGLGAEEITGREVVEMVLPLIENAIADHELVVEVDETAVVVVDASALKRIVVNLLTNAAKFSEPGSTIRLEVAAGDDEICFRVVDRGVGIAPDQLEQVFERFHQVADNPRSARRGVGVGLSIVKGYTEALGGTVSVSSEPGVGSTFEVCLPSGRP